MPVPSQNLTIRQVEQFLGKTCCWDKSDGSGLADYHELQIKLESGKTVPLGYSKQYLKQEGVTKEELVMAIFRAGENRKIKQIKKVLHIHDQREDESE
jgi:hypothetical protein